MAIDPDPDDKVDRTALPPLDEQLHCEQVRLVYQLSPVGLFSTLGVATFVSAWFVPVVSSTGLLAWYVSMAVIVAGRFQLLRAFRQDMLNVAMMRPWERRFVMGASLTGLGWGLGGLLLLPVADQRYLTFYAFVLAGMTGGAIASLSPVLKAYVYYLLCSLTPFGVQLLFSSSDLTIPMVGTLSLYTVNMLLIAKRLNGNVIDSLRLRFENHDLVASLSAARDQAESASRAKSEFLSRMSHEIRTPLNGILGIAQLLEKEPLTPEQLDLVGRVRQSGRSLLAIINDILDFSKIEAGQLRIDPHPFLLDSLLGQIVNVLEPTALAKGFRLTIEPLPELGGVLLGDSLRIEQVLVNLIGNAIKFTDRGEVRVRVSLLTSDEKTLCLRFEVKDTGIGIEPGVIDGLFHPFTQADGSITRRFGGTGLGLSICKRLVELMGGKIGVDSTPGTGSTFWFELPLGHNEDIRLAAKAAPRNAGPALQGLRVLVTDDTQLNRLIAEKALSKQGAQVTLACNGSEALECLRAHPEDFDLVLMDVQMPVMDGLEATRRIRGELGLTRLPIIALTAGVMAEEKQAARNAGVTDFMGKPMDLNQLAEMIGKYCHPLDSRP